MKRVVAFLLMVLVLLGGTVVPSQAEESADTDKTVLTLWHNRGSGTHYDALMYAVNGFNETVGEELGYVVEEAFIGGYPELFSQLQLSVQSGESPEISVAANTYVGYLIEDNILENMMPLAERDGFDKSNLLDAFNEIYGNGEGELYSMPYIRSTPLFYYNKGIAEEVGIEIDKFITMEQLEEFAKAATIVEDGETTRWGYQMNNDFGYFNAANIYQLGSNYLNEGGGSDSLEDGVMLQVLTDWRRGVDEGWIRPFDATDAGATRNQLFYAGQLGGFVNSSAGLGNAVIDSKEAGIDLGIAFYPTYDADNHVAMIGGANIGIIGMDKTEEQIEGAWEFIKFLMSDDQVYYNAKTSGYLPVTKSVATYEPMVEFWKEDPRFQVAYDQLLDYGKCQETPYVPTAQDFTQMCWDVSSLLIQEQSITPEEAVETLILESESLW